MAKLPKPEELSKIDFTPPKTGWMDTPVVFKEGMFCHGSKPKSLEIVGFPEPPGLAARGRGLEAARELEGDPPRGDRRPARRSTGHSGSSWTSACAAAPARTSATSSSAPATPRTCRCSGRAHPFGLSKRIHPGRQDLRQMAGARELHARCAEGVVVLLLPVHRVPPLLGLLPLRHRPGRDHDHRPGTAQSARPEH